MKSLALISSHRLAKPALFCIGLLIAPGLVLANSNTHRISFSVTEHQIIENDQLQVVFAAQHRASSADQVSQRVNQVMKAALDELSAEHRQYVKTDTYHVRPHFQRDGRISEWSGQQNLILTLPKDTDISGILSRLQRHLIYQSVKADLSLAVRQQAEQALLTQALKSYQQQAKFLANAFGEKRFHLVETRIQPSGSLQMQARTMTATDQAPSIELGTQTLSVSINGVLKID